jgi:alkaline phosphatase D
MTKVSRKPASTSSPRPGHRALLPIVGTLVVALFGLSVDPVPAQLSPPPQLSCLRAGPMVGATEISESKLWLQTRWPCRVQVRFWPQGAPELARLTEAVTTGPHGDHIATFDLSALAFGTRYDYELYLDGARATLPYPTHFTTQAMWQWRTDPPPIRVAIGSCFYVNETPFDRPGKPYGSGFEILATLVAQQPDLMIWLGDNTYTREPDFGSEAAIRRRYAHTRALPALQPLLATTAHYATWDDHDFGPDNSDRSFRGREQSLRIFSDYWGNPAAGTREVPGVFFSFAWGDIDFFVLDDRYYRNADRAVGIDKRMLGREQLAWLADALAYSKAPFKVIVNGNQVLNTVTSHETMALFPNEQRELIGMIRAARIEGVVFLSGDRHHTELLRRVEPGLYPLYEFTSSPLTAGLSHVKDEADNPLRVAGTWVFDTHSFGLLEVAGPKADRRMTMRAVAADGKELWRHELAASELRMPPAKR